MTSPGPLHGLRVLDLSRLLPGPYASLVLADLGADVVKVEEPCGGDYLRWMPPLVDDTSALFLALNRGKRSIALDLKLPADRARLLALAANADVLLESFRPGVLARLGLSWKELHERNPRLVLASVSGFGQTGPAALRAGHDLCYLALAGVLDQLGRADGPPAHPNVQIADIAGGALTALVGLLAALFERQRTGLGRWVDVSMTEGALAPLAMNLAPLLAAAGPAPTRGHGVLSGEVPSYAIYDTSDGRSLAVAALEPKFWAGFCRALSLEAFEPDGLDAGAAGARARAAVAAVLATKPLADWVAHFASLDVCVEAVLRADELASHPVHAARGTFFQGPHGLAQRTPIRFADHESPPAMKPAPALGADTEAVLAGWLRAPDLA